MIQWTVTNLIEDQTAIVSLNVSKPNQEAPIQYKGDRELVDFIKNQMATAIGAFGTLVGDRATPIDLDHALKSLPFAVEATKGADMVATYDPETPDEAIL